MLSLRREDEETVTSDGKLPEPAVKKGVFKTSEQVFDFKSPLTCTRSSMPSGKSAIVTFPLENPPHLNEESKACKCN